jgi:putative two-component system response regulator
MIPKKYEIMIIDDEVVNLSVLSEILKSLYTVSVFKSGLDALKQIENGIKPDLILLDINMPDINGYELIDRLYQEKKNKDIPVIFISILDTILDEEKGLSKGAVDFISKPFHAQIILARVKVQLELKESRDMLKVENRFLVKEVSKRFRENQLVFDITMDIVTQLVETRDEETAHHITRTRAYMDRLAKRMAMSPKYAQLIDEAYIDRVVKACPLHDIGKVGISDQILLKPGILTTEEYDLMKEHVMIGYRSIQRAVENSVLSNLLKSSGDSIPMDFFMEAMNIVRYHHEHFDGSGYPDGLKGEDIPLSARMMALIDVFDALTNHRVYKPAWTIDKAVEYIEMQSGYQFDPDCVTALLAELDNFKDIYRRLNSN